MQARRRWWISGLLLAVALGAVAIPRAIAKGDDAAGTPDGKLAWLGVMLDHAEGGAHVVAVIDDSPADEAGIPRGAVITAVDGEAIDGPSELRRAIRRHAPGDTVTLSLRDESGAERTVEVTLGETDRKAVRLERFAFRGLPEGFEERFEKALEGFDGEWIAKGTPGAWLGVELLSPSAGVREALGGPADAGVLVNEVVKDSPADKGGLKAGDLIIAVDGTPVSTVHDLRRILGKHQPGDTIRLELVRRGSRRTVDVALGESKRRVFVFEGQGDHPLQFAIPEIEIDEIELPDIDTLRESLEELRDQDVEIDVEQLEGRIAEALEKAREALERAREREPLDRRREERPRDREQTHGRWIDAMLGDSGADVCGASLST